MYKLWWWYKILLIRIVWWMSHPGQRCCYCHRKEQYKRQQSKKGQWNSAMSNKCFCTKMQQHISKQTQNFFCICCSSVILFSFASYATNRVSDLERSKLVVAFQAPWNISHPLSAQRLNAALWIAIDKVNGDPSYIGNYSLQFVYADCGCEAKKSLHSFINQYQKEHISALFGPVCSEAAEVEYKFIF